MRYLIESYGSTKECIALPAVQRAGMGEATVVQTTTSRCARSSGAVREMAQHATRLLVEVVRSSLRGKRTAVVHETLNYELIRRASDCEPGTSEKLL